MKLNPVFLPPSTAPRVPAVFPYIPNEQGIPNGLASIKSASGTSRASSAVATRRFQAPTRSPRGRPGINLPCGSAAIFPPWRASGILTGDDANCAYLPALDAGIHVQSSGAIVLGVGADLFQSLGGACTNVLLIIRYPEDRWAAEHGEVHLFRVPGSLF
jgi:hypothetical protein